MDGIKISRKELYFMVWAESMLSLSKKYAISDVGLRKMCKRMDIPLPKQGYWQKIKAGQSIPMTDLPENYEGSLEVTLFLRSEENNIENMMPSVKEIQKEIENDPRVNLRVPKRLAKPDSMVAKAKECFDKKRTRSPYYGLYTCAWEGLNIRVTPKNLSRALRFMDTFIKAMRARGHSIEITNSLTYVKIEEEEIQVCLMEKVKRTATYEKDGRTEYQATGNLAFKMGSWSKVEWADGKKSLEEQLPTIIAKLESKAKKAKRDHLEYQREREIKLEKERIQQEIANRKKKELTDFNELLKKSDRWQKAEFLRKYIDAVEKKAALDYPVSEEQNVWLLWARRKVDWYDPLIEAKDKLLKDVDRDELTNKTETQDFHIIIEMRFIDLSCLICSTTLRDGCIHSFFYFLNKYKPINILRNMI